MCTLLAGRRGVAKSNGQFWRNAARRADWPKMAAHLLFRFCPKYSGGEISSRLRAPADLSLQLSSVPRGFGGNPQQRKGYRRLEQLRGCLTTDLSLRNLQARRGGLAAAGLL